MINFRYHVVSLISVFLALAVGIILGAGPLKEAIGDQLTGQVAALRTEKEQLRTQLGDAQTAQDRTQAAFAALAPGVLAGTLDGAQVTVIETASGLGDQFDAVSDQLKAAGAQVRGRVVLQDTWVTNSGQQVRGEAAAAALSAGLPVDLSLTPDQQVAQALALALTTQDGGDAHHLSTAASATLRALDHDGLVSVERTPAVASTAVVVLAGSTTDPADQTPAPGDEARDYARDREAEILGAVHALVPATVVAGPASEPDGMVAAVRADGDLQEQVSTVSGVDTLVGQVSVPMALVAQAAGTVGHYGPDAGSSAALPPLPPRPSGTSADLGAGAGTAGS